MVSTSQKLHPDLPETGLYAYGISEEDAIYPGPTLVVNQFSHNAIKHKRLCFFFFVFTRLIDLSHAPHSSGDGNILLYLMTCKMRQHRLS